MNTEKFPEYREKVFQYVQKEIIPKYDEIEECKLHIFPQYMDRDIELIFKVDPNLKNIRELNYNLVLDISKFCEEYVDFHYRNKFMIILNKY